MRKVSNLMPAFEREAALQGWETLSSLRKTQICDTNIDLIGYIRRHETLTGREIEKLWRKETLNN